MVSLTYGLIAFNFPPLTMESDDLKDCQDEIIYLIEGNLRKHENLRQGRDLAVKPCVISYYPSDEYIKIGEKQYPQSSSKDLLNILVSCPPIAPDRYKALCAAVQRVTTIKPAKKRENAVSQNSKGSILKIIEKEIANLDQWQKKAAIEVPEGPQRIRGLAGSGKTVVLALKAAYLHAQHPDWNIAITYHTRALSQQFKDLIERFTLEHSGDKPNWDKLNILHSWGSASEPGVYSEITNALKMTPVNYASAKDRYGVTGAFEGICRELLGYIEEGKFSPIYDAILIDEAQDLPVPFFRLVYSATKNPKRIIWAYDELQNLSNFAMPSLEELFGKNETGVAKISVHNNEGEAKQDIILPVCYRNTPWALTLAHALGFGIYRQPLVQLFDELELWKEIGYIVESGDLAFNQQVILRRRSDSFPKYFDDFITPEDAVVVQKFEDTVSQYEWIAGEIQKNLQNDELDHDDILVIFPNAYTSKNEYNKFSQSLLRRNINSHLASVSTDRDVFTRYHSITCASIYRAKGNEAPVVYIVNSDWCALGQEMIRLRNILFTAITRSRAWVRICGVGLDMDILQKEIVETRNNDYKLNFKIPTKDELKTIRLINRERTAEEKNKIDKAMKSIKEIKELIDSGVLNPDVIPDLQALIDSKKGIDMLGEDGNEP